MCYKYNALYALYNALYKALYRCIGLSIGLSVGLFIGLSMLSRGILVIFSFLWLPLEIPQANPQEHAPPEPLATLLCDLILASLLSTAQDL